MSQPKCIVIWDLDGTLACGKHRLHLLPAPADRNINQAWDAFNLACPDDAPISDNIMLMNSMGAMGYQIVIVTGRSAVVKEQTVEWLDKYNCQFDLLIMRDDNDNRLDIEFKKEKFDMLNANGNVLCAFDDLEHVAKAVRSWGITCHLVTHYDDATVAGKYVLLPDEKVSLPASHGNHLFHRGYNRAISDVKELNKC